jgi:hypothetical protein
MPGSARLTSFAAERVVLPRRVREVLGRFKRPVVTCTLTEPKRFVTNIVRKVKISAVTTIGI